MVIFKLKAETSKTDEGGSDVCDGGRRFDLTTSLEDSGIGCERASTIFLSTYHQQRGEGGTGGTVGYYVYCCQ